MKLEPKLYAIYFENPRYESRIFKLYTEDEYDLEKDRIKQIANRKGEKAVTFIYNRSTLHEELN